MKKLIFFLLCAGAVLSQAATSTKQPVDYVNLFSGTSSSRWMLYPGPSMPFGMVKLSPDNTDQWTMDAGYEYSIKSIRGFGHVHSWMMGSFLTMPTTGAIKTIPGKADDPDAGYRSRISHDREFASPGYYSVMLDDYGIKAELTATTRAGFQRYTFPASQQSHILFDLNIPEEGQPVILDARINRVSDTEIEGYVEKSLGWNEYRLNFVAKLSKPFKTFGGWQGQEQKTAVQSIRIQSTDPVGAFVSFSTSEGEQVLLKTGISFVSIEQARLNMETELGLFGWDFDAVHQFAGNTWNNLLKKIEIQGGSETDRTKFYTNLYRAYSSRTIFSDVNGKYMDMCEKAQQLPDPGSPIFGSDALWNTFWNLNQLWALVTPNIMNQWVNSLLEIYDRGGWLSKGPGGIEYSSIMVASHEIALIVAAWQQGIRNFDAEKAYRAIKEIQTTPGRPFEGGGYVGNHHLTPYMEMGFVPADAGPVSNTLEYAYDDWSAGQFAKALGKEQDYQYFMKRAQNYKNVFDPTTGYMRPKHAGGPWQQDFVPVVKAVGKEDAFGGKDYVEGNAWQYTWFVPHDVPGLIGLLGQEEFNRRLQQGFLDARPNFVGQFVNHSNQPNMQAAFLFNYAGQPWRTQYWAREILDYYYGLGPVDGYPGDEDQGQMGAWFVMAALGLFQMDGGASVNPVYELSSPLFDKATIHLDPAYFGGGTFTIQAINNSKENRYIQSARLNGKPVETFWISQKEVVGGGELVLVMGPEPNKSWGTGQLPPRTEVEPIVTTPYVSSDSRLFLDSTLVKLACDTKGAEIFYTTDGSEPDRTSMHYSKPFPIDKTTTIKIKAFVGDRASLTATAYLRKADLSSPVNPGRVEPGLSYSYFEGTYSNVSDFANQTPKSTGVVEAVNLSKRQKNVYFAFKLTGFINVPADGLYTFYLASNDGSILSIDDHIVVNNDGLHAVIQRDKEIPLKAGLHPLSIGYFQNGRTSHLTLHWKGPGFEKEEVPATVLFHQ